MKMIRLDIKNFRGIRNAALTFSDKEPLICIIGPGDSGKSTLLKAIEWVLSPSYKLPVTDTDFFGGAPNDPIDICISITEFDESLSREDKFGLYLRDAKAVIAGTENDEPMENEDTAITIRLTIDDTLEPKWEVFTNHGGSKSISGSDRKLLPFGLVGDNWEKDFKWGSNSILHQYQNDSKNIIEEAKLKTGRKILNEIDLSQLNTIAPELIKVGADYGAQLHDKVQNKILINDKFSSGVYISEGDIPLINRGLGSKRLLSMGLNINAYKQGTLILIDELETGLEPYRIISLINELRQTKYACNQIIITTHSDRVICECSLNEIAVLNNRAGEVALHRLYNGDKETDDKAQRILRSEPNAFFCKRIIIGEGKTEIGFLRAIEQHNRSVHNRRFAYCGAGYALGGGGKKLFRLAKQLRECGYDICILMDSDVEDDNQNKTEAISQGIRVFSWDEPNAIEEQIFSDCSIDGITKLLQLAIDIKGIDHVKQVIANGISEYENFFAFNRETPYVTITSDLSLEKRIKLGKIAKDKEWYKNIGFGEEVGNIVCADLDNLKEESTLKRTIANLEKWVFEV